jgi:hypothetical protein
MPELTDDERAVLMICDAGEAIAAIGRWETPVDHLVEIGLLSRADKFNNWITPEGKKAIGEASEAVDDNWAKTMILAHNARVSYRTTSENIASELAVMALETAKITNSNPEIILRKCTADVVTRALELLQEQGHVEQR